MYLCPGFDNESTEGGGRTATSQPAHRAFPVARVTVESTAAAPPAWRRGRPRRTWRRTVSEEIRRERATVEQPAPSDAGPPPESSPAPPEAALGTPTPAPLGGGAAPPAAPPPSYPVAGPPPYGRRPAGVLPVVAAGLAGLMLGGVLGAGAATVATHWFDHHPDRHAPVRFEDGPRHR